MDQIDFSNTDWRYQLRIQKIESKFLLIMDLVDYETRIQFTEGSLTDLMKLTPCKYLLWFNYKIHKSFKVFCVHHLFLDAVASLDLGYENKLEFTEGSIKSQQF